MVFCQKVSNNDTFFYKINFLLLYELRQLSMSWLSLFTNSFRHMLVSIQFSFNSLTSSVMKSADILINNSLRRLNSNNGPITTNLFLRPLVEITKLTFFHSFIFTLKNPISEYWKKLLTIKNRHFMRWQYLVQFYSNQ